MVVVMQLYTASIPIRFLAKNNSFWWGEIGRKPLKACLAAAIGASSSSS